MYILFSGNRRYRGSIGPYEGSKQPTWRGKTYNDEAQGNQFVFLSSTRAISRYVHGIKWEAKESLFCIYIFIQLTSESWRKLMWYTTNHWRRQLVIMNVWRRFLTRGKGTTITMIIWGHFNSVELWIFGLPHFGLIMWKNRKTDFLDNWRDKQEIYVLL